MSAPRLSKAQKAEILRRYREGEPVRTIAAAIGVDPSYPTLLAKRRGETLRLRIKEQTRGPSR